MFGSLLGLKSLRARSTTIKLRVVYEHVPFVVVLHSIRVLAAGLEVAAGAWPQ